MQFNSWEFFGALGLVLSLYYALRPRAQNVLLLLASYGFYACWDWRFLSLLAISTVVDFHVGRRLGRCEAPRRRRHLLWLSLAVNLGILGAFKYFNFFVGSLSTLLAGFGLAKMSVPLQIVLPVGISFYTFQTMAYSIDVYRRRVAPCQDPVTFALYVAYFPQLVAGPIERPGRMIPQLEQPRRVTRDMLLSGAFLILVGLFKKVAIADFLAGSTNAVFADPAAYSSLQLLIAVYCFGVQIYCDFAGYSDIARGVSRLFGIELIVNFRQPYLACSLTDFWRRWHISLSEWLRDYLYIPLGGNRRGPRRTYINLMLTMLLGGLWHGASWNFVIWGGIHGGYLALERLVGSRQPTTRPRWDRVVRGIFGWALTYQLVHLAWIFFRCHTFADAQRFLIGLGLGTGNLSPVTLEQLHLLLCAYAMLALVDLPKTLFERRRWSFAAASIWWQMAYGGLLLCLLLLFGDRVHAPFIYFQF